MRSIKSDPSTTHLCHHFWPITNHSLHICFWPRRSLYNLQSCTQWILPTVWIGSLFEIALIVYHPWIPPLHINMTQMFTFHFSPTNDTICLERNYYTHEFPPKTPLLPFLCFSLFQTLQMHIFSPSIHTFWRSSNALMDTPVPPGSTQFLIHASHFPHFPPQCPSTHFPHFPPTGALYDVLLRLNALAGECNTLKRPYNSLINIYIIY